MTLTSPKEPRTPSCPKELKMLLEPEMPSSLGGEEKLIVTKQPAGMLLLPTSLQDRRGFGRYVKGFGIECVGENTRGGRE
ncbi:hypothetical protein NDU88_003100 [Pleurodeles waltl]|uniref:Uncharacterized protein n=1 Tax=Pleurodeles waltl TaxID=8319 RepID=A0AAV7T494_PLEWA|nr:hypothetical protein NDU88_003100 [Pleurodeles waltl]